MSFQLSYKDQQFDPLSFTKNNFAEFQGLDMGRIAQQNQYANDIANKRLDALEAERKKFQEDTKLHKVLSDTQNEYLNRISSVIDNASKVQLSDNANLTSLNTEISRIKNDPVLRDALYSTEQAKAYKDIITKNPALQNQKHNNANIDNWNNFLNGKTKSFDMKPIYTEFDYMKPIDAFIAEMAESDKDVVETLKHQGLAGVYQLKKSGKSVDNIIEKAEGLKNYLLKQNPESRDYFERVGYNNADKTGVFNAEIPNSLIEDAIKLSAQKHSVHKEEISGYQQDIDKTYGLAKNVDARAWREDARQQQQHNESMNGTWNPSGAVTDPSSYTNSSEIPIVRKGAGVYKFGSTTAGGKENYLTETDAKNHLKSRLMSKFNSEGAFYGNTEQQKRAVQLLEKADDISIISDRPSRDGKNTVYKVRFYTGSKISDQVPHVYEFNEPINEANTTQTNNIKFN